MCRVVRSEPNTPVGSLPGLPRLCALCPVFYGPIRLNIQDLPRGSALSGRQALTAPQSSPKGGFEKPERFQKGCDVQCHSQSMEVGSKSIMQERQGDLQTRRKDMCIAGDRAGRVV